MDSESGINAIKVLFVSHMYPRAERTMYGTFVRDHAIALNKCGVKVGVCNPVQKIIWPLSNLARYRVNKPDLDYKDNLPTVRINWLTFPKRLFESSLRRGAFRNMIGVVKEMFDGQLPDLIHANDLFPDGFACVGLAKALSFPLVVTSHGSDNRVHLKHDFRRSAVLEAASYATRIICVSDFVRRELIELGLSSDKLVTIHNGVDLSRVYHGSGVQSIREHYGNRPIILAVGHMVHFVKGFDITLRAFSALLNTDPNCQAVVVFIGDGVERLVLQKLTNKLGIGKRVYFEGAKSPEETMKYMAACDIYCMPSWYEAFGIVYLEAMMHGKAVVAVEGQGISEIIEHLKTGYLVPPKDVGKTAEALQTLLGNKSLRDLIGQQANEMVFNNYSWIHTAKKTLELYHQILNRVK